MHLLPIGSTLLGLAAIAAVRAADTPPAAASGSAPIAELRFNAADMDRSADPRKDFVKFAAGTWLARETIPADQSRWTSFDALARANAEKIKTVVEAAAADTTAAPGTPTRMVGDFFASGLDTAAIEAAGLQPIAADLARIAGTTSVNELVQVAGELRRVGVGTFCGTSVRGDARQSEMNAFYLTQGGLSLPDRDYYLETSFAAKRDAYREHVSKMLVLAGDNAEVAAKSAEGVLAIETALATASKKRVDLRDPVANYNKLTLAAIEAQAPGFPWRTWLTAAGFPELPAAIVNHPPFLTALASELRTRPLADWQAYVRWHLVRSYAAFLPAAFEAESFRFNETVLRGTPQMEPRWRRVARVVDGDIGEALGQLYVARFFPPEAKARMLTMVGYIKTAFRARLGQLEWMTPETRQRALQKFDAFGVKIGYPDKWKTYQGLTIRRDHYAANVRAARAWDDAFERAKLGQPVDPSEWGMTPPTVNAYFNSTRNEIVFPAGILQPPFFDMAADDAVNFGAIATVIGHEITHGFDDQGRKFDGHGNIADWWQPADDTAFKARAQLLVEQYNGYEALPGKFVNGQLCLGENIADLGGVTVAFAALEQSLAGKPRPALIDGFTPAQRFFLSWGQLWGRTLYRPDAMARQLATDPHSPGNFRAIGPLTNFPDFYTAFGIQEGDPLWRPADKRVKIW